MEQVQRQEEIRWSAVAPGTTFEKKVAASKLVADLRIGDPEKITTE